MASYQGSPFEAGIGPTDGDIVLFAACPPPEELGFEPATGHWRKQLRFSDVQAVWESRPVGKFRGERCMILDDLGDRLHIGYLGHDGYKAEQLGYWQVDRGVFELVAPRTEVSDILEERTEYGRPAGYSAPGRQDSAGYPIPTRQDSAGYPIPTRQDSDGYPIPTRQDSTGYGPDAGATVPAYQPVPDGITGVSLPVAGEAPLPLEAEALRAASAARRPQPTAERQPTAEPQPSPAPAKPGPFRRRRAARRRMATERLFADLADLAGLPGDAYSIGEEVEGAICLVQAGDKFEVFQSADGAQQELQIFPTEESACFYLFGVLAAEAVRNGTLGRVPTAAHASQVR